MTQTPRKLLHAASTTTSSSSGATAPSRQPTALLELGRALAKELGTQEGVDTLGRWMAHYLAEQLQLLEHASGVNKARVEAKVAQLITEIWKHRASLSGRAYPLAGFRKAATALAAIVVGRNANTQWRAPPHAPRAAGLALECFEQASLLASLGVFELLPATAPEIPGAIKDFLDTDERAFLDGIQHVYSAAVELLPAAPGTPISADDEGVRKVQLEVIASLESSLAALRSVLEVRAVPSTPGHSEP